MFTTARNRLIALAAIAAVGAVFSTAPTHARPADTTTVTVQYGDLDLTTEAGVKTLYARLQVAAKEVCRSLYIEGGPRREACYEQTLSKAVAHVNRGMLSALHKNASTRPRVS